MAKANERFRLVWSSSRSDWMIAPETAKGIGAPATVSNAPVSTVVEGCLISGCHSLTSHAQNKKSMLQSLASLRLSTAIALMFAGVAPSVVAQALQDPTVRSGTATIDLSNTNHAVITQQSNKAIIDWRQFSIPSGSTVQFVQPNASSMMLNRVTGTQASQIDGNLLANGQVWLLNPSGVMIGNGGSINTASFLASTLDINNNDFLNGRYRLDATTNTNGRVVNTGTIKAAENGYVVLSGAQINNEGVIEAKLGSVLLGSGQAMTLDLVGDKLLSFAINTPVATLPTDGKASIKNSGRITAQGGKVMMTARTATDVMHSVINVSGVVDATSARLVNGEIVLDGGSTGSITVSGSLLAHGLQAGETGGAIKIFGKDINVTNNALLDARGDMGGGVIHVGGGWQGSGLAGRDAALTTQVASNAVLDASAINKGNGGEIAIWSDIHNAKSITNVSGTLTAKGGVTAGNGGRIETSGYLLGTNGIRVNTSATKGLSGEWLLDPLDIEVNSTGSSTNSVNTSVILNSTIEYSLLNTNVLISTGIDDLSSSGNISINNTYIASSAGHNLEFHANGKIEIKYSEILLSTPTTIVPGMPVISGDVGLFSRKGININNGIIKGNSIALYAREGDIDIGSSSKIGASANSYADEASGIFMLAGGKFEEDLNSNIVKIKLGIPGSNFNILINGSSSINADSSGVFAAATGNITVLSSAITGQDIVGVAGGAVSATQFNITNNANSPNPNNSTIGIYSKNKSLNVGAISGYTAVTSTSGRSIVYTDISVNPQSVISVNSFESEIEGLVVFLDPRKSLVNPNAFLPPPPPLNTGGMNSFGSPGISQTTSPGVPNAPQPAQQNQQPQPQAKQAAPDGDAPAPNQAPSNQQPAANKPPPKDGAAAADAPDGETAPPPKQAANDPAAPAPVPAPRQTASNAPAAAPTPASAPQSSPANNAAPAPVAPAAPTQVSLAAPPPPVAPPPPTPVAAEKPPTPKDAADSGDKTLAMAAPPPPPKAVTQSQATTVRTSVVSPGLVDVQVPVPPRPPSGAAAEQPVPTMGNSARW
jgi:filamentous hemagglutinin family protein